VVDEVRLLRWLRSVSDELAFLGGEARASRERQDDPVWLRGIKYSFVASIEACVDVAQHICSSEGWGPPRDNGDAMRLLADHGVIAAELGRSMRQAVGFRTVLVHEYVEVDDGVVLHRLAHPGDLHAFVTAVAATVRTG